ncbi:enoyl-CoA hydratase [Planobispora rosea]|uniref:Enoyl-CoA hydratase n=1 Tax=Planobispora rosea TaxID=35762 RepID=A0A8J3RZX5_PLARO|nr:enoyl-CoA hydratase-related protein [Planobispora rosea]GGS69736.1 enoyl-CoA hydratase [Planobispora rosea]GIH83172.1 enoyl-CoA hydratase [Planobispora rosea]
MQISDGSPGGSPDGLADGFTLSADGPVATLRIDRPDKRNAMSASMWRALPGILAPLAQDTAVRVLVLTGAGGTFCAGADISEIAGLAEDGDDTGVTVTAERALIRFPKPVIAMIEGFCVGGGCQLALACDLRVAASDARFAITPAKLGIVYPLSSTRRLVGQVGPSAAKLLLYSADQIDAAHALRIGLVDEVLPPGALAERVYGLARTMAGRSQLTLAASKEIVDGHADEARFRWWQKESAAELAEGVAAFLERRPPHFPWTR